METRFKPPPAAGDGLVTVAVGPPPDAGGAPERVVAATWVSAIVAPDKKLPIVSVWDEGSVVPFAQAVVKTGKSMRQTWNKRPARSRDEFMLLISA